MNLEFSLARSSHDVGRDGRRNVYLKFDFIPMERTKNLSLITGGKDSEACKQIMFNIMIRPNFQMKVDILVLGSLPANFSVDQRIHVDHNSSGDRNTNFCVCEPVNEMPECEGLETSVKKHAV